MALQLGSAEAAASCNVPTGAAVELGSAAAPARLAYLRDSLGETARLERRFGLAWSISYVGLAAGSFALLPLSSNDPGALTDAIYGSVSSVLGAATALIEPVRTIRAAQRFERLMQAAPATADAKAGCELLSEGERLLELAAKSERDAGGALAHIGNVVANLGLGLGLAYGFNRPQSAAINTTVGILLGEVMIYSRPQLAVERWERYRNGSLSRAAAPAVAWSLSPLLPGSGAGLAMSGQY